MTGPLKFRFWCDEHGYVPCGFGTPIEEVYFNQTGELGRWCPLCPKARPMTIEKFVGRIDPKQTEIYEGDIVASGGSTGQGLFGVVIWHEDACGYGWFSERAPSGLLRSFGSTVAVIGNIHENADLLEAAS